MVKLTITFSSPVVLADLNGTIPMGSIVCNALATKNQVACRCGSVDELNELRNAVQKKWPDCHHEVTGVETETAAGTGTGENDNTGEKETQENDETI